MGDIRKLARTAVVAATVFAALVPSAVAFGADSTTDPVADPSSVTDISGASDSSDAPATAARAHQDWATPTGALHTPGSTKHDCSGSVVRSGSGVEYSPWFADTFAAAYDSVK